VIHGDPHLGNYTIFETGTANGAAGRSGGPLGEPAGINLLDYGCIRTFPTPFVQGVIDLYTGLLQGRRDLVVHAYETWGFTGLSAELIDTLNIWARFIYGPLLDDREREIADGTTPGQYGRKEAFTVHKALKEKGPVKVPREFVFMDRAAIGLGGVFLHLGARLSWRHVQRRSGVSTWTRSARDRRRHSPPQFPPHSARSASRSSTSSNQNDQASPEPIAVGELACRTYRHGA
jgi:predicted unusual protein kinase regulating ubiquinone biosynthesis (AarF/ABC1/UbiB family)